MEKLGLSEFDKYVKDIVSSLDTEELDNADSYEDFPYSYTDLTMIAGFRGKELSLCISSHPGEDVFIAKTNKLTINLFGISGSQSSTIYKPLVDPKEKIRNKIKEMKFPELVLNANDIKYSSVYLANKSNLKEMSEDFRKIQFVVEDNSAGTLYIQKIKSNVYKLGYNSKFIANCIIEDTVSAKVYPHSYQGYQGAITTLCYLIGHEILHYRNDHFSPKLGDALKSLVIISKSPADTYRDTFFSSMAEQITSSYPEYQNNYLMSEILGMSVSNGGMGSRPILRVSPDHLSANSCINFTITAFPHTADQPNIGTSDLKWDSICTIYIQPFYKKVTDYIEQSRYVTNRAVGSGVVIPVFTDYVSDSDIYAAAAMAVRLPNVDPSHQALSDMNRMVEKLNGYPNIGETIEITSGQNTGKVATVVGYAYEDTDKVLTLRAAILDSKIQTLVVKLNKLIKVMFYYYHYKNRKTFSTELRDWLNSIMDLQNKVFIKNTPVVDSIEKLGVDFVKGELNMLSNRFKKLDDKEKAGIPSQLRGI